MLLKVPRSWRVNYIFDLNTNSKQICSSIECTSAKIPPSIGDFNESSQNSELKRSKSVYRSHFQDQYTPLHTRRLTKYSYSTGTKGTESTTNFKSRICVPVRTEGSNQQLASVLENFGSFENTDRPVYIHRCSICCRFATDRQGFLVLKLITVEYYTNTVMLPGSPKNIDQKKVQTMIIVKFKQFSKTSGIK